MKKIISLFLLFSTLNIIAQSKITPLNVLQFSGAPSTTITTTLKGDDIQIVFPSNYSTSGGSISRLCIYAHGNGGTYTQYPNSDFKDSLLSRGYVIATCSAKIGFGSGNGWGNSTAQTQYMNLYNYCIRNLNVTKEVYLIGMSMGSLVSLNLIHTKAFPVAKYVSLMGVISLDSAYMRGGHYSQFKSGIEGAYNFTGSLTISKSTYGFDPYKRLRRLATDTVYETMPPIYFLHGDADTIASYPVVRQFYKIIKNSNQNITFSVVAGGLHSSSLPTSAIIGNIMSWMGDTYTYSDSYTPTTHNYFTESGTSLNYTTGNVNIGNASSSGQRVLRIGQGTGWVDIGNATNGTGNGFISFNQTTNTLENGALYGGAFSTILNSSTNVLIRLNNATVMSYGTNTIAVQSSRFEKSQGTDVASATGSIALSGDGNIFEITGTSAITLINSSGWQNGSEITLLFTSTASLTDGTANNGTNIGFELAGNTNFTGSADDAITLILSEIGGTVRWREKCRSVN